MPPKQTNERRNENGNSNINGNQQEPPAPVEPLNEQVSHAEFRVAFRV